MVGSAVDTTVWSSAARNMPSMRAPITARTRRRDSSAGGSWRGSVPVSVMVVWRSFRSDGESRVILAPGERDGTDGGPTDGRTGRLTTCGPGWALIPYGVCVEP